jgi:hypothetical protein
MRQLLRDFGILCRVIIMMAITMASFIWLLRLNKWLYSQPHILVFVSITDIDGAADGAFIFLRILTVTGLYSFNEYNDHSNMEKYYTDCIELALKDSV